MSTTDEKVRGLEAQIERLRGAIVAIMDALEGEYIVTNMENVEPALDWVNGATGGIDSARAIIAETPAQSVAHTKAAALRWFAGEMEFKSMYIGGSATDGVLFACEKARVWADRIERDA